MLYSARGTDDVLPLEGRDLPVRVEVGDQAAAQPGQGPASMK
jgi:hypothetical protein